MMSEKPDLSAIISMLSNNEDLKSKNPEEILAKLMSSSSFDTSSSSDNQAVNTTNSNDKTYLNDMPDMETMMKIMKIMRSSNENNPSKDLLNSLKPFLNDSRKEKVDQYIKILGITKALETFNDLGDNLK